MSQHNAYPKLYEVVKAIAEQKVIFALEKQGTVREHVAAAGLRMLGEKLIDAVDELPAVSRHL